MQVWSISSVPPVSQNSWIRPRSVAASGSSDAGQILVVTSSIGASWYIGIDASSRTTCQLRWRSKTSEPRYRVMCVTSSGLGFQASPNSSLLQTMGATLLARKIKTKAGSDRSLLLAIGWLRKVSTMAAEPSQNQSCEPKSR